MLFGQGKEWVKKGTDLFDVPMGCYDGAEVCELVGAYALSTLSESLKVSSVGLYRDDHDDGLGVFQDVSGPQADRLRKDIIRQFADLGLRITIQTNLKVTDFLDVTLNLSTGKFRPYRKPNDRPLYVHRQSNHPLVIIKNLPSSISRRLTYISSDVGIFTDACPLYNDSLKRSGYDEELEYMACRKEGRKTRRNRQRNITWFNPPYSSNVATNIGRRFWSLVSKHFPKNSPLHKIFNRNTLKLSYSCMPNMATIIKRHNNKVLRDGKQASEAPADAVRCNCREKDSCPLDGACQTRSIVYKANVKTDDDVQKEYTGLTAMSFKQRFYNHQQSMRDHKYRNSTTLSKYVWSLKDSQVGYTVKWSIHRRAAAYSNISKKCNLCLAEKLAIMGADKSKSLNKRSELVSKCRHENKYYLSNFLPP